MIQWTRKKSLPLSHWVGRVWLSADTNKNRTDVFKSPSHFWSSNSLFTSSILLLDTSSIQSASSSQNTVVIFFQWNASSTSSTSSSYHYRHLNIIINFDKQHDTVKVTSRSNWTRHFAQKLGNEEAALSDKTTATRASSDKTTATKFNSKKPDLSRDRFGQSSKVFFSPNQVTCLVWKSLVRGHSKRESNCSECSYAKSRASVKSEIAKAYANSNLTKNFPSHIVSLT